VWDRGFLDREFTFFAFEGAWEPRAVVSSRFGGVADSERLLLSGDSPVPLALPGLAIAIWELLSRGIPSLGSRITGESEDDQFDGFCVQFGLNASSL